MLLSCCETKEEMMEETSSNPTPMQSGLVTKLKSSVVSLTFGADLQFPMHLQATTALGDEIWLWNSPNIDSPPDFFVTTRFHLEPRLTLTIIILKNSDIFF